MVDATSSVFPHDAGDGADDTNETTQAIGFAAAGTLGAIVARKLSVNGSPEQISGWLKRRYPGDPEMQISHETIYRSLFIQARGVLPERLVSGFIHGIKRMPCAFTPGGGELP